ncbi:MAG: type II toxin-antitoxin system VapC family toxin [Gammaproteobacteria bacterium]|nr:type II toxin-antitoxin system VapC family toxin [Gammaproteobacteria bacterium]
MILYLDTSALIKLYVAEPGAQEIRKAVTNAHASATHLIAYAETCAAFAKAVRVGRLAVGEVNKYRHAFDRDWAELDVVTLDAVMIHRAGDLALAFNLRGYDSVHLAAAEAFAVVVGQQELVFAAFDVTLNNAARALGLRLISDS